jgi:NAD(P) transhydrogenase subunit alpha
MKLGVLRELLPRERRVAIVPASLAALRKAGFSVLVERGAGAAAGFPDEAYAEAGGELCERARVLASAEIVALVRLPCDPALPEDSTEIARPGRVLVGLGDPLSRSRRIAALAERGATVFALELLPRITRAQAMDVLSSQATIAGYKAVLLAANEYGRLLPLMMTAAGTLQAARVLVLGAGVAGLQAIATARRLGAAVSGYDIRPAAAEQVRSLGARAIDLGLAAERSETAGGYAAAMGEAFEREQQSRLAAVVAGHDIVISTAVVPGAPPPRLVTAEAVAGMAAGSVIVDLAAERGGAQGGNCAGARAGEVVETQGVRILAPIDLAAQVPGDASRLYSGNLAAFLALLRRPGQLGEGGRLAPDADELLRETLLCAEGRVAHARIAADLVEATP